MDSLMQLGLIALVIGLTALVAVGGIYVHFKHKFKDGHPLEG